MTPSHRLVLVVAMVLAAGAKPDAATDETIREVVKSLEASSVARVPLERYARLGLEALSGDVCATKAQAKPQLVIDGGQVTFGCAPALLTAAWPPATSDDVAALLTAAMRALDARGEVRADRTRHVARALARAVDDPFTAYLPPELVAVASSKRADLFQATPGIDVWPRDPTRVREVRRGSDAARAGVEPGDRLVTIDGVPAAGLTLPEIAGKLQGANDSVVRLKLTGTAGDRTLAVTRSIFAESDVVTRELEGEVLYVMLPSFKQGSAARIAKALWDARPRGVILDLRHNGGGYVPEGIALADLFLRDGPIAGVRSAPGRPTEDFVAKRDANDVTEPLVVLVDSGSASASELLAMVLQERGRALVLGGQTAGKGSVQRQIHMPDGGVLKVTVAYYVGPSGRRLDERGVTPDRFLAAAASKTVFEGNEPAKDSWVLSGLDALRGGRRGARAASGAGPEP